MRNPLLIGNRVYLRAREVTDANESVRWSADEDDTEMYRGRSPWSPLLYTQQAQGAPCSSHRRASRSRSA